MSNGYFNLDTPIPPFTKARETAVNALFQAVAAGFDRLPQVDALYALAGFAVDVGATNALAIVHPYDGFAYVVGREVAVLIGNTTTGPATINVTPLGGAPLGPKPIIQPDGEPLIAGQLRDGAIVKLVYNGTAFVAVAGLWADPVTSGALAALAEALVDLLPLRTGQKGLLTTDGTDIAWRDVPDVQTFIASGTWTKPAFGNIVMVEAWGAGGGGSGGNCAGGSDNRSGSGGGGGSYRRATFAIADLPASLPVVIGAGGPGGAGRNDGSETHMAGTNGGQTRFGTLVYAFGGYAAGLGGLFNNAPGVGASEAGQLTSGAATPGSGTGGTGAQVSFGLPTAPSLSASGGNGGGAGGTVDANGSSNLATAGGGNEPNSAGGARGVPGNINGGLGGPRQGGGGGVRIHNATIAGVGGAGGYAGGGGGGASGTASIASGSGGAGGPGFARITTW